MYIIHIQCLPRPKEINFPGTWVTECCCPPCVCWKSNPYLLKEQTMLLSTEPQLNPHFEWLFSSPAQFLISLVLLLHCTSSLLCSLTVAILYAVFSPWWPRALLSWNFCIQCYQFSVFPFCHCLFYIYNENFFPYSIDCSWFLLPNRFDLSHLPTLL